jgi:hypothetical protein
MDDPVHGNMLATDEERNDNQMTHIAPPLGLTLLSSRPSLLTQ